MEQWKDPAIFISGSTVSILTISLCRFVLKLNMDFQILCLLDIGSILIIFYIYLPNTLTISLVLVIYISSCRIVYLL